MDPLLNELQDRAMAGDVNAQEDLDTLLAFQQDSKEEDGDHSRPCTCGSGQPWHSCQGLPGEGWAYCG